MDKRSKILLFLALFVTLISIIFMFDKYIIRDDFEILQNEDGIPIILEE